MKHFNSIFGLDRTVNTLSSKVEICDYQLCAVYNWIMDLADFPAEAWEQQIKFKDAVMSMKVAFDYFYEIKKLVEQLEECSNNVFDEARAADKRLEVNDMAAAFEQLDKRHRDMIEKLLENLKNKRL